MSDTPPADIPAPPAEPPKDQPKPEPGKNWKAEHEKAVAEARKWEDRAKANLGAAKELDTLKRTTMTDLEKAVADARDEGRTLALKEASAALVDAKIEAAATGRLNPAQLASLLDGIDRSKFVDDAGLIDTAKVSKFVDSVAPPKGTLDLGQGQRGANTPTDMNALIRGRMR